MRAYLDSVRPDIIAFQEVENLAAAYRVFDRDRYRVHISERPATDLGSCGRLQRRIPRTGFAVRRDLESPLGLTVHRQPDYRALAGVEGGSRRGMHLVLEAAG